MLLVQVVIYTIVILPVTSFYFYNAATLNVLNNSYDRLAIEHFLFFIAELLIVLFPVSPFYLYTLSSSIFRVELMIMIRCAFACKWSHTTVCIAPIMNENRIRTVSGYLTKSKPLLPSCHFNREKLECTIEINQFPVKLNFLLFSNFSIFNLFNILYL